MKPDWQTENAGVVTIYALLDPVSRAVRYVGKTTRALSRRIIEHVNAARTKRRLYIHRWLLSLPSKPLAVVLEIVPQGDDWAKRERRWIIRFRKRGCRLCNLTDGGEGLAGHVFTAEHRAKIAAALTTGQDFECEQCGEVFFRKQCDIAKGDCRFCSKRCYGLWQRGKPKPVSAAINAAGRAASIEARRRQTHCKRGHPLSGSNLYLHPSGSRVCKACLKIHKRRYRLAGGRG